MLRKPFQTSVLETEYIPPLSFERNLSPEAPGTIPKHLLILCHGRTGNKSLLRWYSRRFAIENLAFLCIQAPYPDRRPDQEDPGFSWYFYHEHETDSEKKFEGLAASRERIKTLIQQLHEAGLPYRNIYWLGFSMGAAMGLDTFLRFPEELGGALCISGICVDAFSYPKALHPKHQFQRLFVTHGTRDEILSWEWSNSTYQHLKNRGVPLEVKLYDKPHSFHLKQEVPDLEAKLRSWIAP